MLISEWPTLNSRAWLRLPCCNAEHPTRVEDFDGDNLVIAAPQAPHPRPVSPLPPDDGFFLVWTVGHTALEAPVVLQKHSGGARPIWVLRQIGEPTETQRRNFVRLNMTIQVQVDLMDRGNWITPETRDLSEGGLRCMLSQGTQDPGPYVFPMKIPLDDDLLDIAAQVAWWGKDVDRFGMRLVGLRFINPPMSVSDRIRSYLFAKQLARRRLP